MIPVREPPRAQERVHQVRRGGLAVGAGDPDQRERGRRMAVECAGQTRQRPGAPRAPAPGPPSGRRAVTLGHHEPRAASHRVGDEAPRVLLEAGNRDEAVAGLDRDASRRSGRARWPAARRSRRRSGSDSSRTLTGTSCLGMSSRGGARQGQPHAGLGRQRDAGRRRLRHDEPAPVHLDADSETARAWPARDAASGRAAPASRARRCPARTTSWLTERTRGRGGLGGAGHDRHRRGVAPAARRGSAARRRRSPRRSAPPPRCPTSRSWARRA